MRHPRVRCDLGLDVDISGKSCMMGRCFEDVDALCVDATRHKNAHSRTLGNYFGS